MRRRHFVELMTLGLPALSSSSLAQAVPRLSLAQLSADRGVFSRPHALRRLLWELSKRTSIEVEADPVQLSWCDRRLAELPFAYLSVGDQRPVVSDCARALLRTYLGHGGTLLVDAVQGGPGSAFARWAQKTLVPLGESPLQPVPRSHVVYKSFYLLDQASGRTLASPDLDAVRIDGRLAILVSHNDLGGAWSRSNLGLWDHEVTPGGERQREMAFRLGINIVMYALCIDYKEDQVHIPFILKKRRRH